MSKEDEVLEELKRIRELLEPKPAPLPPKGLWNEFLDFLSKYMVMGSCCRLNHAIYLGTPVQALVRDFIMPIIGLTILGLEDPATLEIALEQQTFGVGGFLVALIAFIIVAFVIFILVKVIKRCRIE